MSQIVKKFIGDNEVGTAKIRLENNIFLKSRNAANSADVSIIGLNASNERQFAGTFVPSGDLTDNIGSTSLKYTAGYIQEIRDSADNFSIDFENRSIYNTDGDEIINYSASTEAVFKKDLKIEGDSSLARNIILNNGANTAAINLKAPDSGLTSYTLTLPVDDGTAGYVLETDGAGVTSWVAPSGGGAPDFNKQTITLNGTDITNQYVDLSVEALVDSIIFVVKGGGIMLEGASHDYTVSYTGGVGSVTRITFANDLATGGNAALVSGDVLQIQYVVA